MPTTNPTAGFHANFYVSTGVSTATTNEGMTDTGDHARFQVTATARKYLDPLVAVVVQKELDEIQTVTITGAPTGGTFTLTFGANTTGAIAYNASAATVQAALVALASIGAGNVTVTGSAGGPWTVEFTGSLGFASQAALTKNAAGLTGGTSPNVAIVEAQAGSGWTTIAATTYTLQYCGGVVILNTAALSAGVNLRLSTANYLVVSQAGQAKSIEFTTQIDLADVTTFATAQANNGFKSKLALLGDSTVKVTEFWVDGFYLSNMGNMLVIVAYSGVNANQQLACYAYLKTDGMKFDAKAPEEESVDFESHGPVLYVQS